MWERCGRQSRENAEVKRGTVGESDMGDREKVEVNRGRVGESDVGDSGEKVVVKRWRVGARDAGDRVKRKQISSQSQFVLCACPPTTP